MVGKSWEIPTFANHFFIFPEQLVAIMGVTALLNFIQSRNFTLGDCQGAIKNLYFQPFRRPVTVTFTTKNRDRRKEIIL